MGSVAYGLGQIGGDLGAARELQRKDTMEKIKLAVEQGQLGVSQKYADINAKRFGLEEAESKLPKYKGFSMVGGKMVALVQDPNGNLRVQSFDTLPAGDPFATATLKAIEGITDPQLKQAAQDEAGMYLSTGDTKGAFNAVKSRVDKAQADTEAEKKARESREATDERQRRSQQFQREQQNRAFGEREKLSATVLNAGKNAAAVDSAIKAVDTVLSNGAILNDLLKSSKIDLTIDPQGKAQSLIARGIKLSPQEQAVATAFAVLTEHINLLRGPLGATGFRGPQAFQRLQAQRGNPLANPAVTLGILSYTKGNLEKMQRANQQILGPDRFNDIIAPIDDGTLDLQPATEEP